MDALPRDTARLTLRRLTRGDLAAFQSYRTLPEVFRYQSWERMDDAAAGAFLDAVANAPLWVEGEWMQIGVAEPGCLIGDIGLCRTGDTVEMGITLHPDRWGRGLAREAWASAMGWIWATTGVVRIVGIADVENAGSVRMLAAAGLTEIARQEVMFHGEPCVEVTFEARRPPDPVPD